MGIWADEHTHESSTRGGLARSCELPELPPIALCSFRGPRLTRVGLRAAPRSWQQIRAGLISAAGCPSPCPGWALDGAPLSYPLEPPSPVAGRLDTCYEVVTADLRDPFPKHFRSQEAPPLWRRTYPLRPMGLPGCRTVKPTEARRRPLRAKSASSSGTSRPVVTVARLVSPGHRVLLPRCRLTCSRYSISPNSMSRAPSC